MAKIRLGVIGLGSVVREIYQYVFYNSEYSDLIEIGAICDISEDQLHEFGNTHAIPESRRFTDFHALVAQPDLDAIWVNTPDHLHREPVVSALNKGLHVIVPKPTAASIQDAHAILTARERNHRFLGIDFHKREDPRIKEATTRYQSGDYGSFQSSVWYMLDKLMVADPNHTPRFFASPHFAEENTPASFLLVHMVDAFMTIIKEKPILVRSIGYKQKLASLSPQSTNGYDLIDTEILFESGGVCHIIAGWIVPNSAHALTMQSARIMGTEGILDIHIDQPGYHEIVQDGIFERNPLFKNFEYNGRVSGYGIKSPGVLLQQMQAFTAQTLSIEDQNHFFSPMTLGFYTTAVCEAAHESLAQGEAFSKGVVKGCSIQVPELVQNRLGDEGNKYYS